MILLDIVSRMLEEGVFRSGSSNLQHLSIRIRNKIEIEAEDEILKVKHI